MLGLAKGYMDYEGDPILPLVKNVIRKNVEKFTKLSADEYDTFIICSWL